MKMRVRKSAAACGVFACAILSWASVGPARADGDDYFVSELFNPDGSPVSQGGFAGIVKDASGKLVKDATIKIALKVDTGQGAFPIAYNAYTNELGRYRSLDPKGVVADFLAIDVEIDPKTVDVTATKEGYDMARRFVRGRPKSGGFYEIDFVLKQKP